MPAIHRRRFLSATLGGALAVACGEPGTSEPRPSPEPEPRPEPEPVPTPGPGPDADAILGAILEARASEIAEVVTRALREGATAEAIFEAALRAPLTTRNDVVDIHSMAAIPAARRVRAEASDALERVAPLFFVVASNHAWSSRRPAAQRPPSEPEALAEALSSEDYEAADRAMAAKLETEGYEACARWARREGTRIRGDLHAVIWTSHIPRVAALAGADRPLLLRNLVRYLALRPPTSPAPPLRADPDDATAPEEIVRALRAAPSADLNGLSPQALFEAMAIECTETRLSVPFTTGNGVHRSTGFDAYWRAYLTEDDPEARATILARAVRRMGAVRGPGSIDALALREGPGDPFALAPTDTVGAYRAALRACANDRAGFVRAVRARVVRYGSGEHDYKYFGALLDVADRLRTERAKVRWTAGAVAMHVMRATEPWPHHEAARAAARAG